MQTTTNKPIKYFIHHSVNNTIRKDKAIVHDDAFFEITTGKYKGNLVHVWSIVKKEQLPN